MKRMISLLIAFCLSISLMSISVFATPKFNDVQSNQWYYKYVTGIVDKGIMSGTSANSFSPNSLVTRAQVAQTLYAMAGKPSSPKSSSMKDVASGKWYTNAVNWAVSVGVVAGYPDGTFKPNQNVSREQFATVLYSYAKNIEKANKNVDCKANINYFKDIDKLANYARRSVEWAVGLNIMGSVVSHDNWLSPKDSLPRAQLATMLLKYVEYDVSAPSKEDDPIDGTLQTQFYKVDISDEARDAFVIKKGEGSSQSIYFYEKNQYNRKGKNNGDGYVFSTEVFAFKEAFSLIPEYEILGYLHKGDANYAVLIVRPSGVTYDEDLLPQYSKACEYSHEIASTFQGINGYIFEP